MKTKPEPDPCVGTWKRLEMLDDIHGNITTFSIKQAKGDLYLVSPDVLYRLLREAGYEKEVTPDAAS